MVSPPQSAMLYFILLRLDPEMQFGGHLIRGSGHSSLYPAISVQVLHVGRTCGSQHLRLACWDNPSEVGWSKATIAHYKGELHGQRYKMDKVQARAPCRTLFATITTRKSVEYNVEEVKACASAAFVSPPFCRIYAVVL